MGKLPQDLARDFAALAPEARADVVRKLQRYVARGAWAETQLAQLGIAARDGAEGDHAGAAASATPDDGAPPTPTGPPEPPRGR